MSIYKPITDVLRFTFHIICTNQLGVDINKQECHWLKYKNIIMQTRNIKLHFSHSRIVNYKHWRLILNMLKIMESSKERWYNFVVKVWTDIMVIPQVSRSLEQIMDSISIRCISISLIHTSRWLGRIIQLDSTRGSKSTCTSDQGVSHQ